MRPSHSHPVNEQGLEEICEGTFDFRRCIGGRFGARRGTACGGSSSSSGSSSSGISGSTLTIYSSLPLQGTSHDQSQAVINGEKLALKSAGGKVGKYTIKYVSLDDSTAQNPGSADDGQTQQNARKAVSDKSTIYYLGEFNSGGTKVSLPILNQAGIPQISPSNTYVGLTTNEAGSEPGEPQKYYPGLAKYGGPTPARSRGTRSRARRRRRS